MLQEANARPISKSEFHRREPKLRVDLLNLQVDLGAADFPLLILIFGDDRVGGNEVVNLLNEWLDARRIDTRVFESKSSEEAEQPVFWRYWRALPPKGTTAIYFGAWAREAIERRYHGITNERKFNADLEVLNRFERELVLDGTLLLKFYFTIADKTHKKRFARLGKSKHATVSKAERKIFNDRKKIIPMLEHMVARTDTADAPWTVVSGEDDEHRNLRVATTIRDALARHLAARAKRKTTLDAEKARRAAPPRSAVGRGLLRSADLRKKVPPTEYKQKLDELQSKLYDLAARAHDKGRGAMIVFEGWDAAGKGGAIRRLTSAMDVRCYRVLRFAAPTEEESARHYLWRFWRDVPRPGMIHLYDRSWYGRVLVERVEGFAREEEWRRAYAEINDFEAHLAAHGTTILKFWLHIDQATQLRRFRERMRTPYKKYKYTSDDARNRAKWNLYAAAVEEMLARTSTQAAPWILVPAKDKYFARIQVLENVVRVLERAR